MAVEVQPRVFELLVYLVAHQDRTLGKEELQDSVWAGMVVTEASLTRAVMKARRAAGDDSSSQAVIRTVHGHGYRLLAPVLPPPGRPLAASPRRLLLAGLTGLAVAIGAWLLLWPPFPADAGARVAVLPGNIHAALANLAMDRGVPDTADAQLEKALAAFRLLGDRRREAMMLNNRGYVRRLQGRLDQAETPHLQSYAMREELGDTVGMDRIRNMLATLALARGDFEAAREAARETAARYRAGLEAVGGMTWAAKETELAAKLADIHLEQGHLSEAEPLVGLLGRHPPMLESLRIQARYARARDGIESARRLMDQARALGDQRWSERDEALAASFQEATAPAGRRR